jgi:hypothetical protein
MYSAPPPPPLHVAQPLHLIELRRVESMLVSGLLLTGDVVMMIVTSGGVRSPIPQEAKNRLLVRLSVS